MDATSLANETGSSRSYIMANEVTTDARLPFVAFWIRSAEKKSGINST